MDFSKICITKNRFWSDLFYYNQVYLIKIIVSSINVWHNGGSQNEDDY